MSDSTFNDEFMNDLENINKKKYVKSSEPAQIKKLQISKRDQIPWVEKYRPRKLNDIIEQEEIVKVLQSTLKTGDLPHLLLYGPPGTGKTSTILAVAMQLFGPNIINDRVIELNASDDRGIGIVRNNIIKFAKIVVGAKDPNYPCPDFKIVILDEADAMTPDAQSALRKVMESTSNITRFCFVCNYINQIIDPITSRCMKFRFKPIDKSTIIKKLKQIALCENININDECINTIVKISDGDARRAIMILQNSKYIEKYKKSINVDDVIRITGGVSDNEFKYFWNKCSICSISEIRQLAQQIKRDGFPIKNVLDHLKKCIIESTVDDKKKATMCLELCSTDTRLTDGSDEYVQLLGILTFINSVIKNK